MRADKFIGQSNLYGRTTALKHRGRETELYAGWLLAEIELCLSGILTLQTLSDINAVHASPVERARKFSTMGDRAALEALRDAVQELRVDIIQAISKFASLGDAAIDASSLDETDAAIEAAIVTAEDSVTRALRNLVRVDLNVRLLATTIHTMLYTHFDGEGK